MGQKVNPNIFNLQKNTKITSKFIEKTPFDYSVFIVTDLEVKAHVIKFFTNYKLSLNNCKLLHLNNFFQIYISYQQKIKNNLLKRNKIQVVENCFNNKKKINLKVSSSSTQKSFNKNWKWNKIYRLIYPQNYYKKATVSLLETSSILKDFFSSLKHFKPKKLNISLTLEKQNKKLIGIQKKQVILKRKQKLTVLKKYKQNQFFKEGINLLMTCITTKYSSKLLADFISTQIETLKFHNFFVRFVKNTLNLLNSSHFCSKIKGIKINIKGRFNGHPRAKNKLIQISNLPALLKKNLNVDYFNKTAYTSNGTVGVKVWIYQN